MKLKAKQYCPFIILLLYDLQVLNAHTIKIKKAEQSISNYQINTSETKDSAITKKIIIIPESDNMNSTHYTYFKGINITLDYPVTHNLYVGLGLEHAYTKYHPDNGWQLYNVNFLPIFVDSKLNVLQKKGVMLFARLSAGIAFANYIKKVANTPPYNVSEQGIYFYSGIGYAFKIYKYLAPVVEMGFKGFHMSLNQYDVNPHGFTIRIGLVFKRIV